MPLSVQHGWLTAAHAHSVPWKQHFEAKTRAGEDYTSLIDSLREYVHSYEIPQIPPRFNRTTTIPPPKVKTLAATTIVVVPRNLCSQWQSEIKKHISPDVLKVLVMEDLKLPLPSHLYVIRLVRLQSAIFDRPIPVLDDSSPRTLV